MLFALYKDFRGAVRSVFAVLRTLTHRKLLVLFGSALLYSAALIVAARELGTWHSPALKATIYWFVGTAVVLAGDAVTSGARDDNSYLQRVLGRVVTVTILIEFAVNLYALPLAFELIGVLVLFVFSGLKMVAQHDRSTPHAVRRLIDGVLVVVGGGYVVHFFISGFGNMDALLTRDNAEELLVGPVLTITLIPLLLAAAWVSRREQMSLRKRFKARADFPA